MDGLAQGDGEVKWLSAGSYGEKAAVSGARSCHFRLHFDRSLYSTCKHKMA